MLDSGESVNIVTVYFPCYSYNVSYSAELSDCLSFIEEVLDEVLPSVVLGDMNFPRDPNNGGYKQCCDVFFAV